MEKIQWLDVNQLANAIADYLGVNHVHIESVTHADLCAQHHPKKSRIGIGGVLNIEISVEEN